MGYLLDTHAIIWLIEGNTNLSAKAKRIIEDDSKISYASAVSLWEIAIKVSTGKLQVQEDIQTLPALLADEGIRVLLINEHHALAVANLSFHHKDPFDRLLVAQAQIENLILLTKDVNIPRYNVATFW